VRFGAASWLAAIADGSAIVASLLDQA